MNTSAAVSNLSDRYPGFTCFKTVGAIHYQHRWLRDALLWMAFDPLVQRMSPLVAGPSASGIDLSFMTIRADAPTLVVVRSYGRPTLAPDWLGPRVDILRGELRGARMRACQDIWRHKNHYVDMTIRLTTIAKIRALRQVALGTVVLGTGLPKSEAVSSVLAMAATGYVTIDLSGGLDFDSMVSLGPEARPSNRSNAIDSHSGSNMEACDGALASSKPLLSRSKPV